ncbi:hypothetical protein [Streptomyces sp. NPDC049040]|uniref:hypothetical protein n=1 Tax=Streptomyces sp. NPDC049040 TaxID=3365593 RepID=UPI00371AFEA0
MARTQTARSRGRTDRAEDPLSASAPRFPVGIIAWVAAPWALWSHSARLAVLADVLLIGLPTVFGVPAAKKQPGPVPATARPAIALERLQPVAARAAAFAVWPAAAAAAAAAAVAALSVAACVLQVRCWRWMPARPPA